MLTVLGGLAEFERELIRARTGEGRKRAMDSWRAFWSPAQAHIAPVLQRTPEWFQARASGRAACTRPSCFTPKCPREYMQARAAKISLRPVVQPIIPLCVFADVNASSSQGGERAKTRFEARLKAPAGKNIVSLVRPFDDPVPSEVHDLDLITFLFFYHDTTYMSVDRAEMNRKLHAALRSGGCPIRALRD